MPVCEICFNDPCLCDPAYLSWLAEINRLLINAVGLGRMELPADYNWGEAFDSGLSPSAAINILVGPLEDPPALLEAIYIEGSGLGEYQRHYKLSNEEIGDLVSDLLELEYEVIPAEDEDEDEDGNEDEENSSKNYRKNSDEELRQAERQLQSGGISALANLAIKQMRHGFIDVLVLVPAIQHLENTAQLQVAEELRSWPSYKVVHQNMVPIGHSNERVLISYTPFIGMPENSSSMWIGLPQADSRFALVSCQHCGCPIWLTTDCPLCENSTWGDIRYRRRGLHESPWTMERYLAFVQSRGYPNYYQFYVRTRWGEHALVPEYKEIGGMIRQAMLSMDHLRWPSFEEIRLAYGRITGLQA